MTRNVNDCGPKLSPPSMVQRTPPARMVSFVKGRVEAMIVTESASPSGNSSSRIEPMKCVNGRPRARCRS